MEDFGLWDVILSVFWFMLLVAWISLLLRIAGDLFRDDELSGGKKAAWIVLLLLFPWLGALVYITVRGAGMHDRAIKDVQAAEAQARAYIQGVAGTNGSGIAAEFRELAALRDSGVLSPAEYEQAKAKVLA